MSRIAHIITCVGRRSVPREYGLENVGGAGAVYRMPLVKKRKNGEKMSHMAAEQNISRYPSGMPR